MNYLSVCLFCFFSPPINIYLTLSLFSLSGYLTMNSQCKWKRRSRTASAQGSPSISRSNCCLPFIFHSVSYYQQFHPRFTMAKHDLCCITRIPYKEGGIVIQWARRLWVIRVCGLTSLPICLIISSCVYQTCSVYFFSLPHTLRNNFLHYMSTVTSTHCWLLSLSLSLFLFPSRMKRTKCWSQTPGCSWYVSSPSSFCVITA